MNRKLSILLVSALVITKETKKNSEAFPIDIDESVSVSELKKKIKEKVRELKNDICSDIDDGDLDLQLWKVNISNSDVDKFSSLRLQNDEKEGFTHVIVTSNYLINQNLREQIKELTEDLKNAHLSSEGE
ncbi:unnamed protein product [Rhizophagus irregularis]|uniref:Crinkler effector protein N-terminal domain-containing protein n=1 Tax=Rhizophagus irregularis TaxID=588596 RepID=A0A915ZQJ0_9GLOM|nr:unnamed protein product [Rhizophagus irregularis]